MLLKGQVAFLDCAHVSFRRFLFPFFPSLSSSEFAFWVTIQGQDETSLRSVL